jgi:wyosine [tRNA(Phe)-imidazoG37] synthetase (radical SAM superfamily)
VSPIPAKRCSYNCIYCQLGRTRQRQIDREAFFPKGAVLREIEDHLSQLAPDYITFVGDGEPTLSRDLGWLIARCKEKWTVPVAVITNGSLLCRSQVRKGLIAADVVLTSLDAGTAALHRVVNRPHRGLSYDSIIEGQCRFRSEYQGQLWLETMLVRGVNDNIRDLETLRDKVALIKPDRVHIMTPTRPPCENWVKPAFPRSVLEAQRILGETIPVVTRESGHISLGGYQNARQAILGIGSRHPLSRSQALAIEEAFSETGEVTRLLDSGTVRQAEFEGVAYLLPPQPTNEGRPSTGTNTTGENNDN